MSEDIRFDKLLLGSARRGFSTLQVGYLPPTTEDLLKWGMAAIEAGDRVQQQLVYEVIRRMEQEADLNRQIKTLQGEVDYWRRKVPYRPGFVDI